MASKRIKWMSGMPLFLLVALFSWTAFASSPFIHSEGEITIDPSGGFLKITLDSLLEVGWQGEGWQTSVLSTITQNEFSKLEIKGSTTLVGIALTSNTVFDPQSASFTSTQEEANFTWNGLQVEGIERLEKKGLGFGILVQAGDNSPFQQLRMRFNLKQYQDEIIDETFCPSFSSAKLDLKLPVPCLDFIFLEIDWKKDGFEEAWVSLGQGVEILPWLSLGTSVSFRLDEKRVTLSPSLSVSSPPGVDLFCGIDWDAANNKLVGLKLYGIGFHGEVGGVRFRSLTSLAEDEIDLVKDPYWELLGFIWKISRCCGEGEARLAFYFGDGYLFDLSEIDFEGEIPLTQAASISGVVCLTTAGLPSLTLGWHLDL